MGLIRKVTSMSTMGLVDFRSDKERIAKNTKKGYKAQQDGNVIAAQQLAAQQALLQAQMQAQLQQAQLQQAQLQQAQLQQAQRQALLPPQGSGGVQPQFATPTAPVAIGSTAALPPASPDVEGWHPDPIGAAQERWHDGTTWTNEIR